MPLFPQALPVYPVPASLGNGVFDCTSYLSALITTASANGGLILYPAGTFLTGSLSLATNVFHQGNGVSSTTIKLKNATNADLFSANTNLINLSSAFNGGNTGGVYNFGFYDLTLDGNKANQTTGPCYPLHFYGYGFKFSRLQIINGFSGNWLSDWNGGANSPTYQTGVQCDFECIDVQSHSCNGFAMELGGPHDSKLTNCQFYDTASHNIHLAPNASGLQFTGGHCYESAHGNTALAALIESGNNIFTNHQFEGSDTVQLANIGSGNTFIGCRIYSNSLSCSGIQMGQQAGVTPYNGAIFQSAGLTTAQASSANTFNSKISLCEGANGALWLANSGGFNSGILNINNASGPYSTGNRGTGDTFIIAAQSLAADGTIGKSPSILQGNTGIQNATFRWQNSGSIQALVAGNTINTTGLAMARVSSVANIATLVLQAGVANGQSVWVVNTTAFTLTFDVPANSHVAQGTTAVIAASGSRSFVYDTTSALWY